jgi:biotin carboxylase
MALRILLPGYSTDLVDALDRLVPPGSVTVLEEKEVFSARELGARAGTSASVAEVLFADYIQAEDYREVAAAAHAAHPFDVVLPGTEYAVPAAAELAAAFGLPGASPAAARTFRDKVLLRHAADRAGLAGPRWWEVGDPAEVRAAVERLPGGAVLKPADRAGSLGVQFIDRDTDLDGAWAFARDDRVDPMLCARPLRRRFLLEERLRGPEVSVECLVRDHEVIFVNVTDKLVWSGRHPVEQGHDVPSRRPAGDLAALDAATRSMVAATGFDTGVLHAEWILTTGGPALVECAARAPGDNIIGLVDLAYGVDLVGLLVALLAGREVALPDKARCGASIRFLHPAPGRIEAVHGLDEARAVPGVEKVVVKGEPGTEVRPLRSSWDRIGYVLARADAPEAAARAADRAAAAIRVETR